MGPEGLRNAALAALALIVGLLALAAPAAARSSQVPCHAFALPSESYRAVAADPARWTCARERWTPTAPVAWLRFDREQWRGGPLPTKLIAPISRFERLQVTAVDARGGAVARDYRFDEVESLSTGPRMAVALPPVSSQTSAIVVRIERSWSVLTLSGARLAPAAGGDPWNYPVMILVAMLAGLLCAPIIFDLAFFSALRERFLFWHAAMAAGMLAQTLMATGLAVTLFGLTAPSLAILSPLAFALAVAAAAFFSAAFLEPDALSVRMRRTLYGAGWWVLIGPGVLALQLSGLRELGGQYYHLAFQPTVAIFVAAMAQAAWRGSRAAKFQIAAWTPIIVCGLDRLCRGVGLYSLPAIADQAIYLAMALEVAITMLGVADRFIFLRRDRDLAQLRAEELEAAIERDVLTGLYNRRAIEARFTELRRAGFDTLAVIDLDHFKDVNDACGHAVGDRVLAATGVALRSDVDLISVRLGGEEFLLLLRGRDARQRAEACRQAITVRVAAAVPGLPGPVTASMGLVELPRGAMLTTTYAELYAHADRLLYEAKRGGRNRMIGEKLRLFAGALRRRAA